MKLTTVLTFGITLFSLSNLVAADWTTERCPSECSCSLQGIVHCPSYSPPPTGCKCVGTKPAYPDPPPFRGDLLKFALPNHIGGNAAGPKNHGAKAAGKKLGGKKLKTNAKSGKRRMRAKKRLAKAKKEKKAAAARPAGAFVSAQMGETHECYQQAAPFEKK